MSIKLSQRVCTIIGIVKCVDKEKCTCKKRTTNAKIVRDASTIAEHSTVIYIYYTNDLELFRHTASIRHHQNHYHTDFGGKFRMVKRV